MAPRLLYIKEYLKGVIKKVTTKNILKNKTNFEEGNMKSCLVFSDQSSLDFTDVRMGIIRVPEVLVKLKELQENWDVLFKSSIFSAINYTTSEDKIFHQNKDLKGLVKSVIQAGLYERHLKANTKHSFLVGPKNKVSALKIAIGEMTVRDLVFSYFEKEQEKQAPTSKLAGESLTTFMAYKWSEENLKYEEIETKESSEMAILSELVNEDSVKRFVNVGPGNETMHQWYKDMSQRDIQYAESIDTDPMLNWFWNSIKEVELSLVAQ